MVSNGLKFSLFVSIIIVLCIVYCECQNFDTTTNSELDVEDVSGGPMIICARKGSSRDKPTVGGRYKPPPTRPTSPPKIPTSITPNSRQISTTKRTITTTRTTTTSRTWIGSTTTIKPPINKPPITKPDTTKPPPTKPPPTKPLPTKSRPTKPPPTKPPPTKPPPTKPLPTKPRPTKPPPTKPPKSRLNFSKQRYAAFYGGLTGSVLGTYLKYEISKIDWEADMPAYTVRHYWHPKGYPLGNNTIVEAGSIVECPKNVSFCVPNSMPMCLSGGKIYCVTSEFETQPCRNSTVGACLSTKVHVKCSNRWGFDCFLTGSKDVDISIPCLKYTRVRYKGRTTEYNERFYFPSNYTITTPDKNNTCKCNNTQLTPIKINVTCAKINVSESEKTFCSGLNLTNLNLITINSTLNSANSKKVSCSPQNTMGNIGDIFAAQSKSTLASCEFEDGSNGVNMKCGNIANLYNTNVSFPANTNVAVFCCAMENATNFNKSCQCNSTVFPAKPATERRPAQTPVYTVRYCVVISAYPMRLYTNKGYLLHLNKFPELKQENRNAVNRMLTAMGRYLLF